MSLLTEAQSIVSGKVFDTSNQQPLSGVNLSDSSRTRGTTTDANGYFEWDPRSHGQVIYLNHLGYQEVKVTVSDKTQNMRVLMSASAHQLPQLVVSASNTPNQLLEVPGSISLISKSELERDNQTNIADPLNRVPGLFMHSGTLNTNRITVRGIGSRSLFSTTKIRAYLNDIPLTTGDGETSIEDIDLALIDRVEVIKGPASSVYGAGLGGTINMKAVKAPYNNTGISSELMVGSFGLIRNINSFEHSNDKLNLRVNYSTVHQDGYRENNEYDRQTLSVLNQFYPGQNTTLTFWASWIDLKAFIPSSIDSAAFAEDPKQAAFTWAQTMGFEDYVKGLVGVNLMHDINEDWELNASFFGNFRDSYELRPFNILEENSTALGSRLKMVHKRSVGKASLRWAWGVEYFNEDFDWKTLENLDRMAGPALSDNQERRKYYNVFTELNWTLPQGTFIAAGLNYNRTRYRYKDLFLQDGNLSGSYSFDSQLSPRVAINHKFNNNYSIYSQISHGFSPPALSETLTPEGAINPDIQPETGYSFELGTRGQLKDSFLWWDLAFYSMYIKNLLVARRTGDDIFVGVNAGKTRHRGVDVTLNYDFKKDQADTQLHLWVTYGYANYFFKEFQDDDSDFSGNDLTGTPRHKFNWGVDITHSSGLYGNLNFLSVSEMPLRDDNVLFSDAYALMNIKLGFQKKISQALSFKLYGAVNNLWDEKYASMLLVNASSFGNNAPRYFYPGLPRNYYGGIVLRYDLN